MHVGYGYEEVHCQMHCGDYTIPHVSASATKRMWCAHILCTSPQAHCDGVNFNAKLRPECGAAPAHGSVSSTTNCMPLANAKCFNTFYFYLYRASEAKSTSGCVSKVSATTCIKRVYLGEESVLNTGVFISGWSFNSFPAKF